MAVKSNLGVQYGMYDGMDGGYDASERLKRFGWLLFCLWGVGRLSIDVVS